MLPKIRPRSAY